MKSIDLGRFSLGMGDRFGCQAEAQLRACQLAAKYGLEITPVWNKSNREHTIIGSEASHTRLAVDSAVRAAGWAKAYYVDADHITVKTVNRFLDCCDFFTMDVAEWIGSAAPESEIEAFAARHGEWKNLREIEGVARRLDFSPEMIHRTARRYLLATQQAAMIYRHIVEAKKDTGFIAEISMDETDEPQTPEELLIILAAIADQKIPVQTIAPKFIGRFNKGVDYAGPVEEFERQFNEGLAVIRHAISAYGLPKNLKMSVHSGSDKFSIYPALRRAVAQANVGLHLKTAGTTWLEEVIGLAESGGAYLELVKEIYAAALEHFDELCAPYSTVLDIDKRRLPSCDFVKQWNEREMAAALIHDPTNPQFNPHLRQLMHVGYKMAAKQGARYLSALADCRKRIAQNVTDNLFERHIRPLFLSGTSKS